MPRVLRKIRLMLAFGGTAGVRPGRPGKDAANCRTRMEPRRMLTMGAMKPLVSWATGRVGSFGHAFRGLGRLVREPNAKIHAFASLVVIALGILLRVSAQDWALLALAVGMVWVAEAANTALETLCDALKPEQDPGVGQAKDVSAAAVLLAAVTAAALGALVFLPRLLERW